MVCAREHLKLMLPVTERRSGPGFRASVRVTGNESSRFWRGICIWPMIEEESCDLWYTSTVKLVVGMLQMMFRGLWYDVEGFVVLLLEV